MVDEWLAGVLLLLLILDRIELFRFAKIGSES